MVDLDEVMVSTNEVLLHEFNRLTGKQLTLADWTKYDICSLYNITAADYYRIFDEAEVALRAAPRRNSISGIEALMAQNILPIFVTARRTTGHDPVRTVQWLKQHNIPDDHLHIIGGSCKGQYLANLQQSFDFIGAVDDSLYNVSSIIQCVPDIPVFLMDCPHNREHTPSCNYMRVSCMHDVLTHLNR